MHSEHNRALSALHTLDPGTNRQTWVRIAMAAKDAGLDLADFTEWSSNAANFGNDRECRTLWESIKEGPVKAGTLFQLAHNMGWKDPGRPHQKAVGAMATARPGASAFRLVRRNGEPSRTPPVDAVDLWERCVPATAEHPYIVRKRGRPDGLRVVPSDERLTILGSKVAGWLAVPAWSVNGNLRTLQLIPPSATQGKLNLPGHSFADGVFWVGAPESAKRLLVVEGVGQGWAVTLEADDAAIVSFGAGRMGAVAEATRTRHPDKPLVIVADRGKEREAEAIALKCHAAWVAMPKDKPANFDANDLLLSSGKDALRALLDVPTVPRGRFRVKAARELIQAPALAWLVRGVLPAGGLGCMFGASGSGKSFLALDLSAAVANGGDWFGRRVMPAPVVYVALEGEHGMRQRAHAWQIHHGRPLPDGLRFVMDALDLREAKDREELVRAVTLAGAAGGLLVIDTLNRASGSADENSSRDMGEIIDAAKALLHALGGTVLLIHHSGKDQSKGLRGHSSLHAALDAAIEVSRSDSRREWRIAKSKDDGDSAVHPFRLHVVEIDGDEHGEPVTSCVVIAEEAADGRKRIRLPQGPTQKLAHDALGHLLRNSTDFGRAGAPLGRPCVDLETAILEIANRLPCRPDQRQYQARRAVTTMTAKGMYQVAEGWIWDCQ